MRDETLAARLQRQRLEQRLFGRAQAVSLGRYELRSPLGEGGMGSVYVAHDPELDRSIAIKVLRTGLVEDARWRARLVGEARAMASLSHPHVVKVFEAGEHHGHVFVAMELVDGVSLAQWLGERRSVAEICGVFFQAGQGLAAAHAAGLVHRDFKPHNVVVDREGRAKVMDFGLAWRFEDDSVASPAASAGAVASPVLTQTGALLGTPAYMSPEQHHGAEIGPHSDQWSFCVALFEAVHGTLPYQGSNVEELREQIDAGRVREGSGAMPSWLAAIVRRGLQPDPARRFRSMDDVVTALARGGRARSLRIVVPVVGVVLAGAAWMMASRTDRCSGALEQVQTVWDDAQRTQVADAIGGAGTTDVATRTATILDAYAVDWVDAHTRACATHRDGANDPARLDATMTCLQRRRSAFGALVVVLADADADIARSAVSAALALAPVQTCDEPGSPAEPDDSATEVEVARAREVLDRADALRIVGDHAGARAELAPLLDRCRTLGCGSSSARTLLAWGRVTDDPREAKEHLEEAYWAADEAADWEVARLAATELVRAVGGALEQHAEGLAWAAHAETALHRLGKAADAPLLTATAMVLHGKGDLDGALDHYRRALEAHDPTADPHELVRAGTLRMLGDLLIELGEHAEALTTLRESERILSAALGPENIKVAHIVSGIADALRSSGDLEGALEHHRRAFATIASSLGADHPTTAHYQLNLAQSLERVARYAEALEHAEIALRTLERTLPAGHPTIAAANALIGMQLARLDRPDDALIRFERAQVIFEGALEADHPMVIENLERIAMTHREAGRTERALVVMTSVLDGRIRAYGADHPSVARAHANIGLIYGELGDRERSVQSLERAVAIHERVQTRPTERGEARLQLGQALWAMPGQRERAREVVRAAVEDLRASGAAAAERLVVAEALLREE